MTLYKLDKVTNEIYNNVKRIVCKEAGASSDETTALVIDGASELIIDIHVILYDAIKMNNDMFYFEISKTDDGRDHDYKMNAIVMESTNDKLLLSVHGLIILLNQNQCPSDYQVDDTVCCYIDLNEIYTI
jgi:hypothetical protein